MTGTPGSESQSDRGGRHPASSSRGPLGAHTIERPSPCFHSDAGPAGRRVGTDAPAAWPRESREPTSDEDPHREATCGTGPVTGAVGSEQLDGEVGVTQPPQPEGLLVLIPPGEPSHSDRPPACWWEVGAGQVRRSTLRGDSRRRPGDGDGGVGEPVRSRWASPLPPQSRGPSLMLIPSKRALTLCSGVRRGLARPRQNCAQSTRPSQTE